MRSLPHSLRTAHSRVLESVFDNLKKRAGAGEASVAAKKNKIKDKEAQGVKVELVAGATLTKGDVVYVKSDGKVYKADADGSSTYPALFLVDQNVDSGADVQLLGVGMMKDSDWDFTIGGILYLSTTPGSMTQTAPTSSSDRVQVLGVALAANIVYFNPSLNLIEHV